MGRVLSVLQLATAAAQEADGFANEQDALRERRAHERRQHLIAQLVLVLLGVGFRSRDCGLGFTNQGLGFTIEHLSAHVLRALLPCDMPARAVCRRVAACLLLRGAPVCLYDARKSRAFACVSSDLMIEI